MPPDRAAWGGGGGRRRTSGPEGSAGQGAPQLNPEPSRGVTKKPKKNQRGNATDEDLDQLQSLLASSLPLGAGGALRLPTPVTQQHATAVLNEPSHHDEPEGDLQQKKQRGNATDEDLGQLQSLLASSLPLRADRALRLPTPVTQQSEPSNQDEPEGDLQQPERPGSQEDPLLSTHGPKSEFSPPSEPSSSMQDLHELLNKESSEEAVIIEAAEETHSEVPLVTRHSGKQLFEALKERTSRNTSLNQLPMQDSSAQAPLGPMLPQFVGNARTSNSSRSSERLEDSAFGGKRPQSNAKAEAPPQPTQPKFMDRLTSKGPQTGLTGANSVQAPDTGSSEGGSDDLQLEDISDAQEGELEAKHEGPKRERRRSSVSFDPKPPVPLSISVALPEIQELGNEGETPSVSPATRALHKAKAMPEITPAEGGQAIKATSTLLQQEVVLKANHPDLAIAEQLRAELHRHHSHHHVWSTPPLLLTEFGNGIVLYFWLLQWVMTLLLVMTFLHIPAMYIFITGGHGPKALVNLGTLAGFGPAWSLEGVNATYEDVSEYYGPNTSPDIEHVSMEVLEELRTRSIWWNSGAEEQRANIFMMVLGSSAPKSRLLGTVASIDVFVAILMFAASFVFRFWLKRMQRRMDNQKPVIADYTVMVTGLPPNASKSDLERHFSSWGRVHSLEVIHNDEWFYEELHARAELVMQAEQEVNVTLAQVGGEFKDQMEKQWQSHVEASGSEMLELVQQAASTRKSVGAFVVFSSVQDAEAVAALYRGSRSFVKRGLLQSQGLRLLGSSRITVEHAPEPTNVIWPSLERPWYYKFGCRLGTAVAIFLVLVVSWLLMTVWIAGVSPSGNPLPPDGLSRADCSAALSTSCEAPSGNLTSLAIEWEPSALTVSRWQNCMGGEEVLTNTSTAECPDPDERLCLPCYCAFVSSRDRELCPDYKGDSPALRRVIVVFSVLIFNALVQALCPFLVRREAYNTHTRERRAVALKLALSLAASTAAVPVVANMAPSWPWRSAGRYPDMTASWIGDVGVDLFIVMCCMVVFAAARMLLLRMRVRWRERRIWHALNQAELNSVVMGPSFDLPERLGVHLGVFAVVLMFSGVVPILCLVGIVYFCVVYMVDKASILRICRMPPIYSVNVILVASTVMQVAAIGRLLISGWALSLYHTGSVTGQLANFLNGILGGLWGFLSPPSISKSYFIERGVQDTTALHVVTLLVVLVVLLLGLFVSFTGLRWPSNQRNDRVAPLLSDVEAGMQSDDKERRVLSTQIVGPRTYGDFRSNVAYARPHTAALLQSVVLTDDREDKGSVPIASWLGIKRELILAQPWQEAGLYKSQGRPGQNPREGSETVKISLPPGQYGQHYGNEQNGHVQQGQSPVDRRQSTGDSSQTGMFGALFETLVGE